MNAIVSAIDVPSAITAAVADHWPCQSMSPVISATEELSAVKRNE